jgi:TolA-binding protein
MNPEDEIETKIHVSDISGIKVGDYIYACAGWKEKFNQQSTQITELMAWIDNQTVRIAELESKIADLKKRNEDLTYRLGKEQVVTMQDRETQLQKHIQELEKKVEFWSGVAMKYAPDEEVMEG